MKIYLYKILGNTLCWLLLEDLFTKKYREILYVENCWNIYLHKILGNTLCWLLLEDLFTENTEKYLMLNTVRRCIYTQYWEILSVEHCRKIYLRKILWNTLCWALMKIYLYTILGNIYVEHCWKIYLHKILWNTLCWALMKIYLHKIQRNTLC
jgi:hypothetical protein